MGQDGSGYDPSFRVILPGQKQSADPSPSPWGHCCLRAKPCALTHLPRGKHCQLHLGAAPFNYLLASQPSTIR